MHSQSLVVALNQDFIRNHQVKLIARLYPVSWVTLAAGTVMDSRGAFLIS